MNVYVLYVLVHKTSKKIRLTVCLYVRTYVRTWILAVDTINFEGVWLFYELNRLLKRRVKYFVLQYNFKIQRIISKIVWVLGIQKKIKRKNTFFLKQLFSSILIFLEFSM